MIFIKEISIESKPVSSPYGSFLSFWDKYYTANKTRPRKQFLIQAVDKLYSAYEFGEFEITSDFPSKTQINSVTRNLACLVMIKHINFLYVNPNFNENSIYANSYIKKLFK